MLQVDFIRNNKEKVIEGLKIRNIGEEGIAILDEIIKNDDLRKQTQTQLDEKLAQRNKLSKEIGGLYKSGKAAEAEQMKQTVAGLKSDIETLEGTAKSTNETLIDLLLQIPNTPHPSVPPGKTDEDNVLYKAWPNKLPVLPESARPHWELAKEYNLFDLELGVKLTGAGFPVFRGLGAKLERSLINFFLEEAVAAGYEEIIPPLMVNEESARATGQLPDKEGQMYHITKDDFYLIPTSEVPVTNIYRKALLNENDFPIKLTAYTPCFRREAGSYGADVRGLNRVHQFDKVEIVRIEHPDKSYDTLYEMLDHVSSLLDKLELPYRIVRLCGGDLGFTSALTYDFEVYSAAQKKWLEVSSVSNFENFQANRLKLRYKDGKKNKLAHTLNGSALALARIVAALLENNQTPDGIVIPKALQEFTRFDIIPAPKK